MWSALECAALNVKTNLIDLLYIVIAVYLLMGHPVYLKYRIYVATKVQPGFSIEGENFLARNYDYAKRRFNLISTRLFLHPICTGRGKFAPLSKNRLVSDRSTIFCLLKLFFVKFLKIHILR